MYEKLNQGLSKEVFGVTIIILLGIIGFGAYKLHAVYQEKGKVTESDIHLDSADPMPQATPTNSENPSGSAPATSAVSAAAPAAAVLSTSKGEVVASKSGSVYHLPTCPGAKRILPQNQRWFKTIADAKAAGLKPSSTCKGLK